MGFNICMNKACSVTTSSKWKEGWEFKPGVRATLCNNCGLTNESGWRECERCEKAVHCGCIASKRLYDYLGFGGVCCIQCLETSQRTLEFEEKLAEGSRGGSRSKDIGIDVEEDTGENICQLVSNIRISAHQGNKNEASQRTSKFDEELAEEPGGGSRSKETGIDVDEDTCKNSSQLVSNIHISAHEICVLCQEQDGSKDFSVPGAGGIVSSCFEPHLAVNAELEEKDLMENPEKLVQEETWDIEDGSQTNILSSSMQVFLIIRRSLERCSALTENQKLSSLFKAFQKILKVYATKLLGRLPEGGSWIVAAATGLDGQMKTSDRDEKVICYIVNTAEYCCRAVGELAGNVSNIIEPQFVDIVDMTEVQDKFSAVITRALITLVHGIVTKFDSEMAAMTRVPWGTLESVGDQSGYVNGINTILSSSIPVLGNLLSPIYFQNFLEKLALSLPRFYDNIFKCKPISEKGAQQMLLDTQAVKKILLDIPSLAKQTSGAASYSEFVSREMSKAEASLEVILSPSDSVTDTYHALLPEGTPLELQRLLELKIQSQGVFDFIEEPVHSPSTSFDAAPPLQARVARRPIHVPGLKKTSQRYWPRMTDRELEEMSELLNCTIIPCFEKVLSVTDVGQNSRIVIPKLCAEKSIILEGIPIEFQDISGKKWTFQFRFWLKSDTTRTYVLDGVSDCIHSMHFEAGDTITFSQMMPDKNWLIGARKAAKNDAQMELKENNELVDPWSGSTINSLLENLEADIVNYHGYFQITGPYPGEVILASLHKSGRDKELEIGGSKYRIKKCPGEGAFTQVLKAHITGNSEDVVLKIRKPPFPWEFYMYRQLDLRIPQSERMSFGFAREMHLFTDCSIIISDYLEDGTLQDAMNLYECRKISMTENLCIYYTIEMLHMLEALHEADIIHGDLKPDNLLLRYSRDVTNLTIDKYGFLDRNGTWKAQGLCLIGWGRGIDLRLFPPETKFIGDKKPAKFRCIEMQEHKPWKFQVDTYGLCAIVHTLLHRECIKSNQIKFTKGVYEYQKTPKRYWKAQHLWQEFFSKLFNVKQSQDYKATLQSLRWNFEDYLCKDDEHIKDLKLSLLRQKESTICKK